MSFAPGQFITAQRLNRLQPKTYFSQASSAVTTVVSASDVPGTAMSITVETNGATASFWWTAAVYATGAMTAGSNANTQAWWDVNASPTFALGQWSAASEKGVVANFWSTSIPTAGTYTFKLKCTTTSASQIAIYTSLMVQIAEVA